MGFADEPTTYDHVFLIRDDGGYLGPEAAPEALPVGPVPPGEAPLYLRTSRVFGRLKARHKDIFDFLVIVTDDLTGGHRRGTRNLHRSVQDKDALGTRRLMGVATLSAGCLREQPAHGSRAVLHEFRHLESASRPQAAVTLYQAAFVLLTRDPERAVKEGTADLVNECRKSFEVLIYEATQKLLLMRTNLW
ncbi:hypothetical protein [Actinocorallia populi]|uniref:hypothetical protein n=1 Tax=Actinocorallia populi TaxID=2079200 RepID=UPI000D088E4B|nr:hypothetical protein [Actinocorallia populi]